MKGSPHPCKCGHRHLTGETCPECGCEHFRRPRPNRISAASRKRLRECGTKGGKTTSPKKSVQAARNAEMARRAKTKPIK